MTTRSSPFGDDAFSAADARARGLAHSTTRGPMFDRPFHGVARWRAAQTNAALSDIERRCRDYAPRLRAGQFFSHTTALALWRCPLPRRFEREIHVSTYMPADAPRTRGVIGHRLRPREGIEPVVGAVPAARPAVAWAQACVDLDDIAAIAAGDFLIARGRRLATLDELRAELRATRRHRYLPLVDEMRDGSESPKETELRVVTTRAGLPEAVLNMELRTASGRFLARLDEAYPQWRVGVEFDGLQHATDAAQYRRDADRWDGIRDEGWYLVRILNHHLRDGGAVAVEKVRRALWDRGWRPGA